MKLTFQQLKEFATGAVRIEQAEDYVNLRRFTEEQQRFYEGYNLSFFKKTFATAGVRLRFKTDSTYLNLKAFVTTVFASTRGYYSFDVKVNGKFIGAIDNYGDAVFEGNYAKYEFPLGEVDGTVALGEGSKTVEVYFPYTVKVDLKEVNLSDGAVIEPLPQRQKLLCFGDSITHGHDSTRNYRHYTAQLADALDLDLYNKGIGGEVFKPELARCKEPYDPKMITVAYGTNDWSKRDPEAFEKNCREFYKTVSELYPKAKIFGITPPWCASFNSTSRPMTFIEIAERIEAVTSDLQNVTIIRGDDLIPHDLKYFGDLNVHPSNEGFDCYFKNLYAEIKKYI